MEAIMLLELWSEARSFLDLSAVTKSDGPHRSINVGETFTIEYILHNTAREASWTHPRVGFWNPALVITGTQYAVPIDRLGAELTVLEVDFPDTFLKGGETTRTRPIAMIAKSELPGDDMVLGSDDFDAMEQIATVRLTARFDIEGYFGVGSVRHVYQEIDPA
jgi:hypothetical protein